MSLRQFLYFTALTVPACLGLILWVDQPAALFFHRHTTWAIPFFDGLTNTVDNAYNWLMMTNAGNIPLLFLGLLLAYVGGRWGLKQPWATVFLVTLLTHLASTITTNVLKGSVGRLRPEVLFGAGYEGLGLGRAGPFSDSFPSGHTALSLSLLLPLAVVFPRWRVPLLLLPVLIGVGRWVLGKHYLSDVWFSAWEVTAWTMLFGRLYRFPRTQPRAGQALPDPRALPR